MNLEITPLARRDISDAARYYRAERIELGDEFLEELDQTVAKISDNPLRFEQVRPGIRRCLMHRFPYGIYFRLPDANTVRIIVVRHHGRRPGFGLRRQ
jgi:toxin ParE1/3/4